MILARPGRSLGEFRVSIVGRGRPYDLKASPYHHFETHFWDQPLRNVELILTEWLDGLCARRDLYGADPPAIHH